MSRVLEDTLNRFDLPYQVIGGTKFYERAEIKDAVAYLSLLANPADQVSFARIVNSPRRGIGNTTQGRLAAHANTTGKTIWEVIEAVEEVPGLNGGAIKAVSRFYETMAGLRERAEEEGPVAGLLEAVLNESGYLEALSAERTIEAEGRAENLEALVGGGGRVRPRAREGGRERSAAAGGVPAADLPLHRAGRADGEEESLITLMTLHNAKGLEYDTVFIVGCEDGAFPHMRALEEGGEEEERRLCYVGITRARRRLYMTWARERRLFGRAERNLPSRFVDELPAELTERHSSAPGSAAGIGWDSGEASGARADRSGADPGAAHRRRRRPRQLRRRGRHRGRAGRRRRRPLRRRRHRAQADGRLRTDQEALRWRHGSSTAKRLRPRCGSGSPPRSSSSIASAGARRCWSP